MTETSPCPLLRRGPSSVSKEKEDPLEHLYKGKKYMSLIINDLSDRLVKQKQKDAGHELLCHRRD